MKKIRIFCAVLAVLILLSSVFSFNIFAAESKDKKIATPATSTLKTNGNGGKTDVGTWFVTYNNPSMWGNNFGSGFPILHRPLIGYEENGDPIYGIPNSDDPEIIDFMIEQMAAAKIDFIIFDLTNGGVSDQLPMWGETSIEIWNNAILTCERLAEWNDNNDWKIKYSFAVGAYADATGGPVGRAANLCAEVIWKKVFENEVYGGDDHYQIDGKPLLILHDWSRDALEEYMMYGGDTEWSDKFTIRKGQEGEPGSYGWRTYYGTLFHEEVMLVAPGWRSAAGKDGSGILRENGAYYRRCWETVFTNPLPRILMVVNFNDYNEDMAVYTADTSKCNPANDEKWIDETGKENPSMYWDMTIDGIRRVRAINGEEKYVPYVKDHFKNIFNPSKTNNGANGSFNVKTVIIIAAIVVVVAVIAVAVIILIKKKNGADLALADGAEQAPVKVKKEKPKKVKKEPVYDFDEDFDDEDFDDEDFDDE